MTKTGILLLTLVLASGPYASAQSVPVREFETVFQVISAKNALSTSFRTHLRKMQSMCVERNESDPDYVRKGNVKCVGKTDITRLGMSGSEAPAVSMIDATIVGREKCAYMRSLLIQQYGKPAESKGKCDSKWLVIRGNDKPVIHVVIEESVRENVVYFSNQEEQGP